MKILRLTLRRFVVSTSQVLLLLVLLSSCTQTQDDHPVNNKSISNPLKILTTMAVGLSGCYGASDVGMIAYFDQDCPDGWEEYDGLVGRVAVGAGNYIGTAEDGRKEPVVYSLGNIGGEVDHKLIINEMPSHTHFSGLYGPRGASGTVGGFATTWNTYPPVETGSTGDSQPHNNMPPYLVLTPCIKTVEDTYVSQKNLSLIRSEVDINSDEIENMKTEIVISSDVLKSNITTINERFRTNENAVESIKTRLQTKEDEIQSLKSEIADLKQMLNDTSIALKQITPSDEENDNNQTAIYATLGTLTAIAILISIGTCIYSYQSLKNKPNPDSEYQREVVIKERKDGYEKTNLEDELDDNSTNTTQLKTKL